MITPTEATNFELATNEKLGRGATADVFKKEIHAKNFAIKIYKNPQSANWSKINLLTELGQKEDYEFVKNHLLVSYRKTDKMLALPCSCLI